MDDQLTETLDNKTDKTPRLERIAQVLEAISASPDGLALAQISSRTGMPMPSTHRLVNSLLDAGFITGKRGRSRYRLGARLVRIFQASLTNEALRQISTPFLQPVADRFREVVFLVRLVDFELRPAVTILPNDPARSYVYPGNDFPLNGTASAKAIVAYQDPEVVERFLSVPLSRYRPNTVTDPSKMRAILEGVRNTGYAINDDEYDPGVYSMCAPVFVDGGGVLYGVGLVGFKERLLMAHDPDDIVRELKGAAEKLSESLRNVPESAIEQDD
ncbi:MULTISPECIES: IclR family transcriptional regulator [unclassified Caballeronia]|uniref:IclR family transcriptional regulator n=1 Tax=unclassified Caballeronia TaxID=2646786 RepID=UPI0020297396|nr:MULTISPECIES: IclR family transcriptional regulator [unclassified Caballeronia]